MNYWKLRQFKADTRQRITANLQRLRRQLHDAIPTQTTDGSLVVGTWNIRNFDDNRFGHGPRLAESFFYIGEIISAFDAIAVQEITTDLTGFNRLKDTIGSDYSFILTDATEGSSGNDERLGFGYNRRKVTFQGIAGEVVLPRDMLISTKTDELQFSRTPFGCLFQSGWFKFMFATVHIYYGKASKQTAEYQRRVDEIQAIANFLSKRADQEGINYILVGDFNIDKPADDDAAFNALAEAGFQAFLNREGSNKKKNKFYDQISFKSRENQVELATEFTYGREPHGVFDPFESIFRDDEFAIYDGEITKLLARRIKDARKELASTTGVRRRASLEKTIDAAQASKGSKTKREEYYLNEWRTFQISDHLPLWVTLQVDFTDQYLSGLTEMPADPVL